MGEEFVSRLNLWIFGIRLSNRRMSSDSNLQGILLIFL